MPLNKQEGVVSNYTMQFFIFIVYQCETGAWGLTARFHVSSWNAMLNCAQMYVCGMCSWSVDLYIQKHIRVYHHLLHAISLNSRKSTYLLSSVWLSSSINFIYIHCYHHKLQQYINGKIARDARHHTQ